jgi:hypothetical protein
MILTSQACFNPRPGHVTGATQNIRIGRPALRGFNPRPGHVTGATCPNSSVVVGPAMFQSAPRSRDRGDGSGHSPRSDFITPHGFNPRPGHATGATTRLAGLPAHAKSQLVSIRAPVTRPGRPDGPILDGDPPRYVSIRAPVTRPGRRAARSSPGEVRIVVSIRAPVTRPGRRIHGSLFPARVLQPLVSIRAPVTRPGRHGIVGCRQVHQSGVSIRAPVT